MGIPPRAVDRMKNEYYPTIAVPGGPKGLINMYAHKSKAKTLDIGDVTGDRFESLATFLYNKRVRLRFVAPSGK
ncbi:MAG: hypothetical protein NPIRA01_10060 [Nitrospirales bacterium]|nr:MAG: hypothetical protein NPIRA01_10060 [Nitrospirales bacterium]